MKVLLLSAYAAQSHTYWHEALVSMFPDWDWRILTLPPRHFSWRIRGNPLYWSIEKRDVLESQYDLLVATSMVDLATLRGLVPTLANVRSVLYFHENQFEYPQADIKNQQRNSLLEAKMVSLYSSLAADQIVFNSAYNRDTFLQGCNALLKKLPDKVPRGVVDSLRIKSSVLAVPLKAGVEEEGGEEDASNTIWPGTQGTLPGRPLRLLWLGRFEYDKGGECLHRTLQLLDKSSLDFELAIVGQQFRHSPRIFAQIESEFQHRIVHFGYIESRLDYNNILSAGDVVLSTALHEFQGLAILEAVAAGCLPAVPNRLVYPEIMPEEFCYTSDLNDVDREAQAAADLIVRLSTELGSMDVIAPDVGNFTQPVLKPQYKDLFTGS